MTNRRYWTLAAAAILAINLLALLCPPTALAQGDSRSPSIGPAGISFPLQDPPSGINGPVSVTAIGQPGQRTFWYWGVAHGEFGAAAPSGPYALNAAANLFGGGNGAQFSANPTAGASSYDILRTPFGVTPAGACNCAVAIGLSTPFVVDNSESLLSYTVATANVGGAQLLLSNIVTGFETNCLALITADDVATCLNSGGGMVYPPGTGVADVVGGAAWGATSTAGHTIPADYLGIASAGPTIHEWIASYDDATGTFTLSRPSCADLSDAGAGCTGGGGGGGTPGGPLYSVQTNVPLGTFNGAADLLDETPILGPLTFTGDGLDFETTDLGTATDPEYLISVIENGTSADGCPACFTLQSADGVQGGGSMYVSTYGRTGGGSFQVTSLSPSAADEAPAGGPGMIYLQSHTNAQGDGFVAAQIDLDAETYDGSAGSGADLANMLLTTCANDNPVGTLSCDITLAANPYGVGDGASGLVRAIGTGTQVEQSETLPASLTSSTALYVAGGYSLPPGGIGEGQAASVVVDYGANAFVGYAYGVVIDTPAAGTGDNTDNSEASLTINDPTANGDGGASAMEILGGESAYYGNSEIVVADSAETAQGAAIVAYPYTTDDAASLFGETNVQPQAATPSGTALYAVAYGSEFAAVFQGPVKVQPGGGLTIEAQAFTSLPPCSSVGETYTTSANTNIIGATITADGSYAVQAFCDGTNWVVAAGGVAAGVSLAATTPSLGGALLAAGCTNQAAVTVPGALTTMACAMSGTAGNPANLQPQCSVSAADTVIPQLCTAFGLTPAAQTYNLRVF